MSGITTIKGKKGQLAQATKISHQSSLPRAIANKRIWVWRSPYTQQILKDRYAYENAPLSYLSIVNR